MKDHRFYIEKLELEQHPEGGWYKETYRSKGSILPDNSADFEGPRSYSTGIYFLLTQHNFSAFHRIKSDEMWHFYDGSGSTVHEITSEGRYVEHRLGLNLDAGEQPQLVIEANSWFASEVTPHGIWSLVGCTVAPGFDFQDFELADRNELCAQFPSHASLITRLTRS